MNPARSGGEISYAVLEVIYDDRKVRQSAVHKCHAQLPCKCLARYQARPCLALRTALVHGKIPKPLFVDRHRGHGYNIRTLVGSKHPI